MNIQQLRYVVAIANSGTFREAAEKMYVSQPSLSISVRDLEKELGFKIFRRTSSGTFLTRRGMEFYEKRKNWLKDLIFFKISMPILRKKRMNFPLPVSTMTSCHQPLRPLSERYPDYKNFRIFESTTVQILDGSSARA